VHEVALSLAEGEESSGKVNNCEATNMMLVEGDIGEGAELGSQMKREHIRKKETKKLESLPTTGRNTGGRGGGWDQDWWD